MNQDLQNAIDELKQLVADLQAMRDHFITMCQIMQSIVPGFICPFSPTITSEQMLAYATVWEYEHCQEAEPEEPEDNNG